MKELSEISILLFNVQPIDSFNRTLENRPTSFA